MGRRGDRIGGSLGRRPPRDRVDIATPLRSSVVPSKGKGWGIQGEAQYLDLLDHWDKEARWQSWRKGMSLAHSGLIGVAERFTAVAVEHRAPYLRRQAWQTTTVLLAGFTSRDSPEGRWTVAIQPRGAQISNAAIGPGHQREFWHQPPVELDRPRRRLLELSFDPGGSTAGLQLNTILVGEVVEDSAINATTLEDDATAGIGMLCVAVQEDTGKAYFDAERIWRRFRTGDGRLITREIQVDHRDPLPQFRPGRHLTQGLTLSCNCPSHSGLVFTRLLPGSKLGAQGLFPQRSPSGLHAVLDGVSESDPEGVRRRFRDLPWLRLPGHECKHCSAVRFAFGAPIEEPSDMPSLMSDYWQSLKAMGRIEEIDAPMSNERFVEQLRLSLLSEEAFSQLDALLLAAAVGDCLGVVPQRVQSAPITAGPPSRSVSGLPRQNEQHAMVNPLEDSAAEFGDWWVPVTGNVVRGYTAPGVITSREMIKPLADPQGLSHLIP